MSDIVPSPPPLAPAVAPPSAWYGASALGLTFGGQNIARRPDTSLRFTVIPLPVMPSPDVTMPARADAISASFTGRLESAVDLYRQTVEQNGHMLGILWTMGHGLQGMPLTWLGDPEMCSALSDADGTPGDYARMFPENECAKILSDAIGMGFGLGQLLLMCWRCDGVEWLRTPGPTPAHVEVQTCLTCRARLQDRPLGTRQLYQLRWRDARWLWRNPVTLEWFYTGRQGMVRVNPGDGEWVLIKTVPDLDIWNHGPWKLGTEAAIFARDGRYDRQNTSRSCAPTHVYKANAGQGTDPRTRADIEAQADGVKFGNSLILPGEWDHRIDSASGDYHDVTQGIIGDVNGEWEVCITGNRMGTESGTGFANMDVYNRTTRERRRFYGNATWARQIRAQALVWWGLENYGTRNVPVGTYDTRSPEDKKSGAEADEQEGKALVAMVDGYAATGFELEPAYVIERAQQRGVRLRPMAKPVPVPSAPGTPPGTPGITPPPKDGGGAPTPPAPAPAAAAPGAPPPPAPAGRLEAEPEDDDYDDEDAARLAAEMTAQGYDRCYHGRTHACPRCGVRAVYSAGAPGADGQPTYRVAWRALRGRLTSRAPGTTIEAAEAELDAALAALEALGPEDDDRGHLRAQYNPDQPRDPDGKFGSGAGSLSAATKKGTGRSKAAAQARKDSKAARIATWRAKIGHIGHDDAAAEHDKAEKQNREAAARSKSDVHRQAHLAVAEAHAKLAAAHREAHAATQPAKPPPSPPPPTSAEKAAAASKAAAAASAAAEAGTISHAEAAEAHYQAGGAHIIAKNEAATDAQKDVHKAALVEHKKAHDEHQAKAATSPPPAAPPAAPKTAATAPPTVKAAPLNVAPSALSADVKAKIAALPKAPLGGSSVEVLNGTKVAQEHIGKVLPSLSKDEKYASLKFSNGHDYEMRALERGVSKDDLVKSRMAKEGGTEKDARAHVEASAKMLPAFHAALDKLKTTTPPPPPLYRGMTVSERTLHELLTKDEYDTAGMSSSASLSEHTATGFADSNRGKKDYRGDLMTHAVVLVIHKATSSPLMHTALSDYVGEREQVLPRDGKYKVTKRERDTSGRIAIHLEEV